MLEESVVSKMETTAIDIKRYNTNYYNLDVIIAVGYRVLKEFIIKDYVDGWNTDVVILSYLLSYNFLLVYSKIVYL